MINKKFKTYFTNSRMVWYEEEAELDTTVGFYGHIQQISPEVATSLGISYTKGFQIWCPVNTDVIEGDELKNENDTYNVKGIKTLNLGLNKHKKVFVEKVQQYG